MKTLEETTREIMTAARNDDEGYNQAFINVLILVQKYGEQMLYQSISGALDDIKEIYRVKQINSI